MQLLNQIFEKKLERLFPYICIILRIFNPIPVSVAEGERSFSKLKVVKNSLRSTMGQDRVTDLLIISIEEDLAKKVSYDDVIDIWAAYNSSKNSSLSILFTFLKVFVDCPFIYCFKTNMLIQMSVLISEPFFNPEN